MYRPMLIGAGSMLVVLLAASHPAAQSDHEKWAAANRAVVRLAPDDFKELPTAIRRELTRRGCRIPQESLSEGTTFRNFARGHYFGTGTDWAVLCSRDLTSSILVFRDARPDRVFELASKPDADFLQGSSDGRIAFPARSAPCRLP